MDSDGMVLDILKFFIFIGFTDPSGELNLCRGAPRNSCVSPGKPGAHAFLRRLNVCAAQNRGYQWGFVGVVTMWDSKVPWIPWRAMRSIWKSHWNWW